MLKILIPTLFFLALGVLSASAQSGNYNRCEIKRIEDIGRFEQWLNSKRIESSRQSTTTVYTIPIVVHVLFHADDEVGEGFNFSTERIRQQIKTLNEDFRRKENTPGFNTNPDGGDARIEFVLAQVDPDGNPTDGIVRVNMSSVHLPPDTTAGDAISAFARYSYWNPDQYLNIWCVETGLPPGTLLGSARFPISDLEGLPTSQPEGDGVFINALNFGRGETNTDPHYNMGRTLTHEIGHFLGLLHIWGNNTGNCGEHGDYCNDTPPADSPTDGCPALKSMACNGKPKMIENYMDYSYDQCMNIFTNDQISRMHAVLENSPHRKSLTTSVITGVQNNVVHDIEIYPNPATDTIHITVDEKIMGNDIRISGHTLLGQRLFEKSFTLTTTKIEIPVSEIKENVIVLTIETADLSNRKLLLMN